MATVVDLKLNIILQDMIYPLDFEELGNIIKYLRTPR